MVKYLTITKDYLNTMDNYDNYTDHIRQLYNEMDEIWPTNDKLYLYTKSIIEKKVGKWINSYDSSYILNAGSGGTEYEVRGKVCHLDIAENKIRNKEDFIIGSIENIPIQDELFDFVICVGSVINYINNISAALEELTRTLKNGGFLILEYERTNTAELWFKKNHNDDCFFKVYQYNGAEHGIWLYSDKLINSLMFSNSMKLQKQYRFHSLSSVAARFNRKERTQFFLTKFDKIVYPFSYFMAHNRICLWKKSFS